MYPTDTKSDTSQVTVETLKAICRAVDIPVVAIGGIRADRIQPLKGTGADGVAVVSAIFGQPDIEAAARRLKETAEMYLGRQRRRKTVLTIAGSDSSGGAGDGFVNQLYFAECIFNQIKEVPCFNCEYPMTMTRMRWAFVIIHTVKDQH